MDCQQYHQLMNLVRQGACLTADYAVCICFELALRICSLYLMATVLLCAGRWNRKYDLLFIDQPVGTGFSIAGLPFDVA